MAPGLDEFDVLFEVVLSLVRVYAHMRVRLRMIFKYTEIVCRKTHDVYANA